MRPIHLGCCDRKVCCVSLVLQCMGTMVICDRQVRITETPPSLQLLVNPLSAWAVLSSLLSRGPLRVLDKKSHKMVHHSKWVSLLSTIVMWQYVFTHTLRLFLLFSCPSHCWSHSAILSCFTITVLSVGSTLWSWGMDLFGIPKFADFENCFWKFACWDSHIYLKLNWMSETNYKLTHKECNKMDVMENKIGMDK